MSPFLRRLIFQSYVYFYYASRQFNESTGVTRRCVSTDESFFSRTNDTAAYDNALSGISRDLSLLVNRFRATALSLFMQSSVTLQLVCRVTRFLSACDKHAYFYIDTYRVEREKRFRERISELVAAFRETIARRRGTNGFTGFVASIRFTRLVSLSRETSRRIYPVPRVSDSPSEQFRIKKELRKRGERVGLVVCLLVERAALSKKYDRSLGGG